MKEIWAVIENNMYNINIQMLEILLQFKNFKSKFGLHYTVSKII